MFKRFQGPWFRWMSLTLAVVAILLSRPGGSHPAIAAAAQLPTLTVSGNQLVRNGKPFYFHGVNRDTLEWGQHNWGGCGGDGHFTAVDFDNIAKWDANVIRLPLSQADLLGRRCDAAAYLQMIDGVVARANAHNLYVILDLHWSDVQGRAPCDTPCTTGEQPMPDADSIVFWHTIAARYGSNPGVLFDLYNEPHDVSWSCWRDGGCTAMSDPATGHQLSYVVTGMQALYNTARRYAPTTVVLAAGLDWAYDLSGIGAGYALAGSNIVYDTHVYTQWHSTAADWDSHFGYLTARYPVSATEFGSTDCASTVTKALLSYFDAPYRAAAHRMSWSIWSWNAPAECSQPSIIADWSGTPLGGQGQMIHDTLLALSPPSPPTSTGPLNRTSWKASASSSAGAWDMPANALDGDEATRWSTGQAQTSGAWFAVDLGSVRQFNQITMDAGTSHGDYPRGYAVYTSLDGVTWGVPVSTGSGGGDVLTVTFPSRSARAVKVVQTGSTGNWWSIAEFTVSEAQVVP